MGTCGDTWAVICINMTCTRFLTCLLIRQHGPTEGGSTQLGEKSSYHVYDLAANLGVFARCGRATPACHMRCHEHAKRIPERYPCSPCTAGDPEGGIRLYERALAFNPRYPDALYNLGVACGECGLSDRAVFAYEMAAQLNPSCAEVGPFPET